VYVQRGSSALPVPDSQTQDWQSGLGPQHHKSSAVHAVVPPETGIFWGAGEGNGLDMKWKVGCLAQYCPCDREQGQQRQVKGWLRRRVRLGVHWIRNA